jgi:predicted PurR-regulated permease PerM
LIFLCIRLLYPFAEVILWGIILALAASPVYNLVNRQLGNKPKIAATIVVLSGLVILLIPTMLFINSMVHGVRELKTGIEGGTLSIPMPAEKVAEWPVIGKEIHGAWKQASENLEEFVITYNEQITRFGSRIFEGLMNAGGSIVQFIMAIIIAGVLLATKGTDTFARKFFKKVVGAKGDEFIDMAIRTVRNVLKGIIGVALMQSFITGIGFVLAGVPYAGIWTLLVLILGILQLPPAVIVIPVIIWLFSSISILPATLWTIYLLIAGLSDNVLKPIMLGKGAAVPMVVIFLGVIGGFMVSGFIGLFTGAIVISIGYKLFLSWIDSEEPMKDSPEPVMPVDV